MTIAPRETTFTYYRLTKTEHFRSPDALTPEIFTSNALEELIIGEKKLEEEPGPIELVVTNLPFGDRIIPSSSKPLESFSRNSRIQWRTNTLANQFAPIPIKHHAHIFTLYGSNDVDLALYWNMPDLRRHGHHYIIGINLGVQQNPFQGRNPLRAANRALFEQTVREKTALVNHLFRNKHFKEESPLKLVLSCADTVEHDFKMQSICVLPITVSIRNCSWNKNVSFRLEMLPYNRAGTTRSSGHRSSYATIFQWTGPTFEYGVVGPDEERTITVRACCTRPGVYDINRWRLTVNVEQSQHEDVVHHQTPHHGGVGDGVKGYVQMPNSPHLVTVVDCARLIEV